MNTLATLAFASAVAAFGATAALAVPQVTITAIADLTDYDGAVAGNIARETFETFGNDLPGTNAFGIAWDQSWVTGIGTFRPFGLKTGDGSVCRTQDNEPCGNLFLAKDPSEHGQGNTVPDDGVWAMSSNDTEGMIWTAETKGSDDFNFLAFVLQDIADQANTVLTVSVPGGSNSTTQRLANGNKQLVTIFLGSAATKRVEVSIFNESGRVNDGFTFDGGALALRGPIDVSEVPLPAPALLLLGGIAGLGALRGLKRKAA
jgi:hypothetical protein